MKGFGFVSGMNFRGIYRKGLGPLKKSGGGSAWGLEIRDSGLKAVKALSRNGELFIEKTDRVDYSSTGHEITDEKQKLIEDAVRIFKERNSIGKSEKIIVSLSGKMILSRFFTLPPIKKNRVADALRYELRKQVPFEPDEIVWDYQQFEDDGTPDKGIKIGLFATKKENIYGLLPSLTPIGMNLDAIQITPIAIYNLVHLSSDSDEDVIVINVEKGNTDFIVVGRSKYWNRSIPLSEVNMTFIREIQRSIGYYVSVSKGVKPKILYLMGEIFEDENNIKFIGENLENKVKFLDLLDKIKMVQDFEPSESKKVFYGFETALGLAIQGLNLGEIKINLLPLDYVKERKISRQKILACVIAGSIFLSFFTQSIKDYIAWRPLSRGVDTVNATLNEVKKLERIYTGTGEKIDAEKKNLHVFEAIGAQGRFWVEVINKIIDTIPENVYLLSIESLWGIPRTGGKEETGGKGFFGGKEEAGSIDTSKEALIINIKGESYAPEVSYIEEKVKKPIGDLTFSDQTLPVFSDVRFVQGSVRYVKVAEDMDLPEGAVEGIRGQAISFEMQCIVNPIN